MTRFFQVLAVVALALTPGCGDGVHELFVELRTDLSPDVEFDEARAELRDPRGRMGDVLRSAESGALASHDYLTGRRIAEWSDVAPGAYVVRVEVLLASTRVADVLAEVQLDGDRAITVQVSSECAGVVCPGFSDAPELTSCLYGICVPPSCLSGAAAGCPAGPPDGGVDATTDAPPDSAPTDTGADDTGLSDTAVGDTGGDAGPLAPTCENYCATIMRSCRDGDAQYADDAACLAYCEGGPGWTTGTSEDMFGNSIGCRLGRAVAAMSDPAAQCLAAGPSGDNDCGSWCEVYCAEVAAHCTGSERILFSPDCPTVCGTYDDSGRAGDVTGDTVQCRIYHGGLPATQDSATHCPHASEGGDGVCIAP